MPLIEKTLFGTVDKVAIAIERLQAFVPPEGYWLAFSGGKDSVVLLDLAKRSGVAFKAYYSNTTVDPPELYRFIREHHPEVTWLRPKETMWQLIVRKRMPPTRVVRYCCDKLKEANGEGIILTGIRWAESARRSKRKMAEFCSRDKAKKYIHPIIDWTDEDIWEYIRSNEIPYCKLYDEGTKRIGCVLCPMSRKSVRERERESEPKIYAAYVRAFQRMIDKRRKDGMTTKWETGQEVFDWWLNDDSTPANTEPELDGLDDSPMIYE